VSIIRGNCGTFVRVENSRLSERYWNWFVF